MTPPSEWKPNRKVVGAAVATLVVGVAVWAGLDQPPAGVEGAFAVLVAYLLPDRD